MAISYWYVYIVGNQAQNIGQYIETMFGFAVDITHKQGVHFDPERPD